MVIKTQFKLNNGMTAFSINGSQASSINGGEFNFKSPIIIYPSENKFQIDNCWESGDIWQISNNTVIKRTVGGDIISSLSLDNPISLSVVQPNIKMPTEVKDFATDDLGAWVISDTSALKLNNQLSIENSLTGFIDPKVVITNINDGCLLCDDGAERIYSISKACVITGYITYSQVSPYFTSSNDIVNIKVDSVGKIWIALDNDTITGMDLVNGGFTVVTKISLFAYGYNEMTDIDVGRNNNEVFAIGASPWIAKWDSSGVLLQTAVPTGMSNLVALRVSQFDSSDLLYLLSGKSGKLLSMYENSFPVSNNYNALSSITLNIAESHALTIRHDVTSSGVFISSSQQIPFSIKGGNVGTPYINENEYMTVIREKVDMSANGPSDVDIKNIGKDIGEENYKDSMPYRPKTNSLFTVLRDPRRR